MFPEAATHTQRISAAHVLSKAVVHWYLSEAVAHSLRNIEIHLGAATHLLKHKKICSEAAAQIFSRFLHKIYTLCVKIFITFHWLWKHLWRLLSQKRYISPSQYCYSIGLHNPLIIVSVQGILMLINRVHLMLLILKQHLLSLYRFTIK